MAQRASTLAAKSDDMNLILGAQVKVEGENRFHKAELLIQPLHGHAYTHTSCVHNNNEAGK